MAERATRVEARRIGAFVLCAALLSACGGGSHAIVPATGSGSSSSSKPGALTIKFTLPAPSQQAIRRAAARHREYVSAGSTVAIVSYANAPTLPTVPAASASLGSGSIAFDLTSTSAPSNCSATSGARTCTLTLAIPAGHYNVILSFWSGTYSATNAPAGSILSQSPVLGVTQVAGQAGQTLSFTFNPEVASAQATLTPNVLAFGSAAETTSLNIILLDGAGSVILDDGTGNALLDTTGAALTLSVSATDTDGTIGANCAAPTATSVATTSYTTIPAATGDTVTYNGNCVVSSLLAVKNGATTLASTTLQISGISQEFATNPSGTASTGPLVLGADGKVYAFFDNGGVWDLDVYSASGSPGSAIGMPTSGCAPLAGAVGNDGNVWFTEYCGGNARLAYITPLGTTGDFLLATSSRPAGITSGSDANLWITDSVNGAVYSASANTSGPSIGGPYYIVPAPAAPGVTTPADGASTIAAGTYSVQVTYTDATGQTLASSATSTGALVADSSDIDVACPTNVPGATDFNVYINSTKQNGSPIALSGCVSPGYTQTTNPTTGGSLPLTNTAAAPSQIINGPNSQLWMTDTGSTGFIDEVNLASGTTGVFPVKQSGGTPGGIVAFGGSDVAYTEAGGGITAIGVMNMSGTTYDTAAALTQTPTALVTAADGNIYSAGYGAGPLAEVASVSFNTVSNTFGAPVYYPAGLASGDNPGSIISDDSGGNLWMGLNSAGDVARFWLP